MQRSYGSGVGLKLRAAPRGKTTLSSTALHQSAFLWTGADEFSPLGDRLDAPPLPLPSISAPKRVVLVRHGQSTWNAEGRIQGCSDFSELTPKGVSQAETTRDMLENDVFDVLWVSPLTRARQTADAICAGRSLPTQVLPALREIDLYSFQGLLKAEGKALHGDAYTTWQRAAAAFEIDGHAPVRELWFRGSLAWQSILGEGGPAGQLASGGVHHALVVAHNAVNQALIATALGLPPAYFRRLLQSNAATTVLDFQPPTGGGAGPPRVTLDRLNQSPGPPYAATTDGAGRRAPARLVLVRHAATPSSQAGVLLGATDEPLGVLGALQAGKAAELLLDMQVHKVLTSPLARCTGTATIIADLQREGSGGAAGGGAPVEAVAELANLDVGAWQGQPARLMRGAPLPEDAEPLDRFWERTGAAWDAACAEAGADGGRSVVVVAHAAVLAALVCRCLGLGRDQLGLFRFDTAGVSIVDFPDGVAAPGVVRTLNYSAHLGRWAVPITQDDLDEVCGIDGCM